MIKCEICGFEAKRLVQHIKLVHGLTSEEYTGRIGHVPEGLLEYNKTKAIKHKNKKQEKIDSYKKTILEKYTSEDILRFYEQGHSPVILVKGGLEIVFDTSSIKEIDIIIAAIKSITTYTSEHKRAHLKMPTWWRNKWDWGLSDEEAKIRQRESSARGAATVQQMRKNSGTYTKQYTVDYWISQGYSHEDAIKKLVEYKKNRSPRNVSFWLARGYDEETARRKVSETCAPGGVAACKLLESKFKSKLEDRIAEILDELEIKYERQFYISDSKKTYVYDFLIHENKILEVNGTYWHADPRVYSANDFNGASKKTSQQIWEFDAKKNLIAEKNGKKVLIIWEMDIVKSTREQMKEKLRQLCSS